MPTSASVAGSSSRPQRTITQPLAGELDERAGRARLGAAARADEEDLPFELEPGDARFDERAGGEVVLDRRARDERDAVAATHRARHGLLQAELEPHVEVAQPRPGAAQLVLDHLAHARALLHHDQLLVAQVVERHRPARERVTGRAREDHGVVEERLVLDAAVARRGADDAELERAVGDALDDGLRVEDAQRDVQRGVHLRELAEELREHDAARPGRRADLERAVERAGRLVCELADDLLFEREQALGAAVEPQPGLGRLDPPARAVEELRAEPLLERAHLQADRRLGHPEALRRLGERLALDHLAERLQLPRVHKGSLYEELPRTSERTRVRAGLTIVEGHLFACAGGCGENHGQPGSGLAELEAVAERVGGVEAARIGIESSGSTTIPAPFSRAERAWRDRRRRGRDAPCGPGRTGLDADVQLLRAGPEPAAAARAQRLRLRQLLQAEQPAVERARLRLAAGGAATWTWSIPRTVIAHGLPSTAWQRRRLRSRTRSSAGTHGSRPRRNIAGSTSSCACSTSSSPGSSGSCSRRSRS